MSRLNHQWISQLPIKNIKKLKPVSGGDINEAYQITTDINQYLMKVKRQSILDMKLTVSKL